MLNDKELLELAAKAAGLRPSGRYDFQTGIEVSRPHSAPFQWNPFINGSDALWLAAELNIDIRFNGPEVCCEDEYGEALAAAPVDDGDRFAAAMRSIVLAAAEKARQLP
ncbi:hypothetical protein [Metapseudomonas otitidis]|uniref:hypothetical protein n=1 Tax=Metapseudomonas otitidis TaxID=319939 RepID=UPI0024483246|nr:hypothetical protein [Pseudomonas otitidis]MDH0335189.1 hypothetical protein [Pseudomonas otitidis]